MFKPKRILAALGLAALLSPLGLPAFAQSGEIVMAAPRDLAPGPQDAYYTSVILYVWEPLIAGGEDGEPIPALAESWEMSEDGKEWTFRLREGVVFHDGAPLDADAVLANFDRFRAVSPKGSPFYTMNIDQSYPGLLDIIKVDDLTFRLTFDSPKPTLLYSMVNFSSPIYSPASFDADGNFATFPQGTGPFKLVEHEPQVQLLLEANENYWGEPAQAEAIRIRTIPDPDTRLSALLAEEIMGVMDLGAIPPEQATELVRDDRFEVSSTRSTISHYLHPNGGTGIFSDVRLRQAVSYALDRDAIVDLYRGYPTPTANLLNDTSPFYKDVGYEYDPERAVALAREALGDERVSLLLIVPTWGTDRYPYRAQAELIQFLLQPLGMDVEVRILDGAAYNEARASGQYDLAMGTQGLPNADPYTMFRNYMASDGSPNATNHHGYSNPHVDHLIAQVADTLDMDERRAIYNELQDIAAEELPTIPLFNDASLIAYNTAIEGYEARLYGTSLPEVRWAE